MKLVAGWVSRWFRWPLSYCVVVGLLFPLHCPQIFARLSIEWLCIFFFFQAEDGIRDKLVTGVQTCALPICERAPTERVLARVRAGEADPPCRACGGILKTATISFGQSLVAEDLARTERAARNCDLMLAVGTKLSVWPIAGVVPVAKDAGARVVIVNAEPTEMDELADAVLRGSISELLPQVVGEGG